MRKDLLIKSNNLYFFPVFLIDSKICRNRKRSLYSSCSKIFYNNFQYITELKNSYFSDGKDTTGDTFAIIITSFFAWQNVKK